MDALLRDEPWTQQQQDIAVQRAIQRMGEGAELPSYDTIEQAVLAASQRSEGFSARPTTEHPSMSAADMNFILRAADPMTHMSVAEMQSRGNIIEAGGGNPATMRAMQTKKQAALSEQEASVRADAMDNLHKAHGRGARTEFYWKRGQGLLREADDLKRQQITTLEDSAEEPTGGVSLRTRFIRGPDGGPPAIDIKKDAPPPSSLEYVINSANAVSRGAAGVFVSIPEAFELVGSKIGLDNADVRRRLAETRKSIMEYYDADSRLADSFLATKLPQGFGSMLAFALMVGVGGSAGAAGATGRTAVTAQRIGQIVSGSAGGAAANGMEAYNAAVELGLDEDQAFGVFLINAGVGTTEMLPIFEALNRFAPGAKRSVTRSIIATFLTTATEITQEELQAFTQSLTTTGEIPSLDEIIETGLLAAILGGGMGTLAEVGGSLRQQGMNKEAAELEQRAAMIAQQQGIKLTDTLLELATPIEGDIETVESDSETATRERDEALGDTQIIDAREAGLVDRATPVEDVQQEQPPTQLTAVPEDQLSGEARDALFGEKAPVTPDRATRPREGDETGRTLAMFDGPNRQQDAGDYAAWLEGRGFDVTLGQTRGAQGPDANLGWWVSAVPQATTTEESTDAGQVQGRVEDQVREGQAVAEGVPVEVSGQQADQAVEGAQGQAVAEPATTPAAPQAEAPPVTEQGAAEPAVAAPTEAEAPPAPVEPATEMGDLFGEKPPEPPPTTAASEDTGEVFSPKHAIILQNREVMGVGGVNSKQRQTNEKQLRDAIDQGVPERATRIAAEVNADPRVLTPIESAGLTVAYVQRMNEHAELTKEAVEATDPVEAATKSAEALRVEQEYDNITRALFLSGSERGRALQSQKLTINRNYDLVSVLNRAKIARKAGGKDLSKGDRAQIESLVRKLEAADQAYAEKESEYNELLASRAVRLGVTQNLRTMNIKQKDADLNRLNERLETLLNEGCDVT